MKSIFGLLLFLILFSFCFSQPQNGGVIWLNPLEPGKEPTVRMLYKFLKKAEKVDSLEYNSPSTPFLFFKSGYFLSSKEKNAIIAYHTKKFNYKLELILLSIINGKKPQKLMGLKHNQQNFTPFLMTLI